MKEALAQSASAFSGTPARDCYSGNRPLQEESKLKAKF